MILAISGRNLPLHFTQRRPESPPKVLILLDSGLRTSGDTVEDDFENPVPGARDMTPPKLRFHRPGNVPCANRSLADLGHHPLAPDQRARKEQPGCRASPARVPVKPKAIAPPRERTADASRSSCHCGHHLRFPAPSITASAPQRMRGETSPNEPPGNPARCMRVRWWIGTSPTIDKRTVSCRISGRQRQAEDLCKPPLSSTFGRVRDATTSASAAVRRGSISADTR